MSAYTAFDIGLAAVVVPISYILLGRLNRRRSLLRCTRIAMLMTLIGYPWDFFAIHRGAWRYPQNPGPTVHTVPLNDLLFMWLCTQLTCSVLIAARRRQPGCQRHPKGEHAGQQNA